MKIINYLQISQVQHELFQFLIFGLKMFALCEKVPYLKEIQILLVVQLPFTFKKF